MARLISTQRTEHGVAVILLDAEGEKVNKISTELGTQILAELQRLELDTTCPGVVISSGKPDQFVAGADIAALAHLQTPAEAEALSREGQRMMGRIAATKIPVVAAINGPCMGGGLELVLACHARVCSDWSGTRFAASEVQLGLIPGAGGTQRLPRLVGLQVALDLILTGKSVRARRALSIGLVDEVVPTEVLQRAAVARVMTIAAAKQDKEKQSVVESELRELRQRAEDVDLSDLLLEGNPLGRRLVLSRAREQVEERSHGHYPAPPAAIHAVEAGLARGMEHGLAVEAEEFAQLAVSDVCRRLTEIYFATQALKKESGVTDSQARPRRISSLAVLGGGLMGAGIAYLAAEKGVDVRIKEIDPDAAARALGTVLELAQGQVKRRALTGRESRRLLGRVTAAPDLSGIRRADLVIEAVFEDLVTKQELLRHVEERVSDETVLASNTSALPITKIAEVARRPERVLGMHFFSPVPKMPLLEVVVTEKTTDLFTATAVAFGKELGKHVIVVRDAPGFYTSRILAAYINEAAHLLAEGAAIDVVDRALTEYGFPVGPFMLMDEVGIDVGAKVAKTVHQAYGERLRPNDVLAAIVADRRLGRKGGRGFYLRNGDRKRVDETLYELLPGGRRRNTFSPEELQRPVLAMVNEALHCLSEGVLRNPRDGDIGALFGLGFPPYLGGPFRWVDARGANRVLEDLTRLQEQHGLRFAPAPALIDAARDRRQFRG